VSRSIGTLAAEVDAPVVRPFLALRIELPDPVYVWTGSGILIFNDAEGNSRNWLGAGGVGAIDTIGESVDGSATGVRATLLDVPSEFRDDIADQAVRGVTFELYAGALNETYQQVDAYSLIWKGKLDDYKITDAGDTLTVEVVGESRAIDQRRPSIKRFTDEYQQRKYAGDKFFEYVPRMAEVPILWAQAEQSSASVGGAGGSGGAGGYTGREPGDRYYA
jgi:hypothetical protein